MNKKHLDNVVYKQENGPAEQLQASKRARKTYKQIRPKVSSEWSHDDITRLIIAVEKRPRLWDISSPKYKLPKIPAWREIAEFIGKRSADECKAKWANLRVSFKTNLTKSRKQKPGSAAGGCVVWKYFNAMMFLDVNETVRRNESISSMTQLSEVSDSSVIESELTPLQYKHSRNMTSAPPQSSPPSSEEIKRINEMATKAICALDERKKENNQFDAFAMHVAAELRSLPLAKAVFAKRKLARALVDVMDEVQGMICSC